MAKNPIDTAPTAPHRGPERFHQGPRRDRTWTRGRNAESARRSGRSRREDRAGSPDDARRVMENQQTFLAGREALQHVPDVRDDRIIAARERLDRGFYRSLLVTGDVAEKVGRALDALDAL